MYDHVTDDQTKSSFHIDWAHLCTLGLLITWVIWYWLDARSVSTDILNLLLVQPTAILALVLAAMILPQCLRQKHPRSEITLSERNRVILLMLCFVGFVALMFTVGVDIAVFLFTASCLLIFGERRWVVVIGFSLATTLLLIKGYRLMIPYDIGLMFLEITAYD